MKSGDSVGTGMESWGSLPLLRCSGHSAIPPGVVDQSSGWRGLDKQRTENGLESTTCSTRA